MVAHSCLRFCATKVEHGVTLYRAAPCFLHLLNFLLQASEDIGMEKLLNCDTQTVAELFYGRNGSAVVPTAYDIIYCGLRDSAQRAELVDGNISLIAQLQYPFSYSFSYGHRYHPFS